MTSKNPLQLIKRFATVDVAIISVLGILMAIAVVLHVQKVSSERSLQAAAHGVYEQFVVMQQHALQGTRVHGAVPAGFGFDSVSEMFFADTNSNGYFDADEALEPLQHTATITFNEDVVLFKTFQQIDGFCQAGYTACDRQGDITIGYIVRDNEERILLFDTAKSQLIIQ